MVVPRHSRFWPAVELLSVGDMDENQKEVQEFLFCLLLTPAVVRHSTLGFMLEDCWVFWGIMELGLESRPSACQKYAQTLCGLSSSCWAF